MGADQNIDLTTLHPCNDVLQVRGRLKARDHLNGEGPVGKPVPEVGVVLVGQKGSWDQNRTLAAILCGDESGAHGDLGFAKTHVTAHQTIHDLGCTHVVLDGGDSGGLIRRFLKREALAKLLPLGLVQLVGVTHSGLASGVNVE